MDYAKKEDMRQWLNALSDEADSQIYPLPTLHDCEGNSFLDWGNKEKQMLVGFFPQNPMDTLINVIDTADADKTVGILVSDVYAYGTETLDGLLYKEGLGTYEIYRKTDIYARMEYACKAIGIDVFNQEFYNDGLYRDLIIDYPDVRVYRKEARATEDTRCHVITAYPIDCHTYEFKHEKSIDTIRDIVSDILYTRIYRILKAAYDDRCDHLVIGNWGVAGIPGDADPIVAAWLHAIRTYFNGAFSSIFFSAHPKDLSFGSYRRAILQYQYERIHDHASMYQYENVYRREADEMYPDPTYLITCKCGMSHRMGDFCTRCGTKVLYRVTDDAKHYVKKIQIPKLKKKEDKEE